MKIKFTKMHGAGNDFVVIDDRELSTPWENYMLMSAIATRRTGIGCEGIILLQPSTRGDFRMRFLNPDGGEAELCGNGLRCAAAFAFAHGFTTSHVMTIETMSGCVDAEILRRGNGKATDVKIWMIDASDRNYDLTLTAGDRTFSCHSLKVGCPHCVVPVDDVASIDVEKYGALLRQHDAFAPDGTNVDFITFRGDSLQMRTFERGVEAESGACGTGATASAIVAVERLGATLPLKVTTSSGFELLIGGEWRGKHSTGLTLTGPVAFVYNGEIELDMLFSEHEPA